MLTETLQIPMTSPSTHYGIPSGTYHGVLYRIIDLGHQPDTFNPGQTKRKLLFSWVIPSIEKKYGDEVLEAIIHKEYYFSLYKTAFLFKDIETMRGRKFEDYEDNTTFDVLSLLGLPCVLTTRRAEIKGTRRYFEEITAFEPLPEDELIPEYKLPLMALTFADFNWDLFNSLNAKTREKIMRSPEFAQMQSGMNVTQAFAEEQITE